MLAGKASKTGPNLHGLPGRVAGTQADFRGFSDGIVALGGSGFTWNEADFVVYQQGAAATDAEAPVEGEAAPTN